MMKSKKLKIAILGWGSLYWDTGDEFCKWIEMPWADDGPKLKLEFSRISETRCGALTLVIDLDHGSDTTVAWCRSRRKKIEDAVADLRCREGTTMGNIGYVRLDGQTAQPSKIEGKIITWAKEKQLNAVVWTTLQSNFNKKTGNPFSVKNAITYLKTLTPQGKAKAAEYVWRAPKFVQTPLRTALQQEPWFSKPAR